jgi:hypothetical protein
MLVHHWRMTVLMRVWLVGRIVRPMGMLVMFIVAMPMLVRHLGVLVLVLMLFGYVQIAAE